MIGSCDVRPPSNVNSAAASPVNATRLVQLANVAIDSHENAVDCRVDSASRAQNDASDAIKLEADVAHSYDAGVPLVTDSQLSRGKSV